MFGMRTTLTIDDDVLAAAKGLASQQRRTVGEVISDLARAALRPQKGVTTRNGVPQLPIGAEAKPVTLEIVNQLRDELP
jgi:hypothetical protein